MGMRLVRIVEKKGKSYHNDTHCGNIECEWHLPRRNQLLQCRQKACRLEWTGTSCPMGNKRETAGAASGSPVQRQNLASWFFFYITTSGTDGRNNADMAKRNEGKQQKNTET